MTKAKFIKVKYGFIDEELSSSEWSLLSYLSSLAWKAEVINASNAHLAESLAFTLKHKHADHETLKPAREMPKIDYPKPDNIITFDKTSSIYLTGTNHADNQPVHLQLKDLNLPINYTLEKFDEPAQRKYRRNTAK